MSSSYFPTGGDRFMLINRQRSTGSMTSTGGGSTSSNDNNSITGTTTTTTSSSTTTSRPRRITMAGMIYDANRILEKAMDPKAEGIHPGLFDPDLLGIGFMTIWGAGLIFSGNIGTGIVFARNPMDPMSWSPPAAVGLSSIGAGLMGGISMKHIVYLIYDYYTLESMSGENGVVISSQAEASVFKFGRHVERSVIATAKGMCKNIALSYDSLGIFGGISVEGGVMKGRRHVNEQFYGKKGIKTTDILFSGDEYNIPAGTLLPEVYTKLMKLCSGASIHEPTAEEAKKVQSTCKQVAEEEEAAAQDISFYMAAEGDESCIVMGSELRGCPREGTDYSENSLLDRNRACSTSSVPSVVLEHNAVGRSCLDLTKRVSSLAITSDSDLAVLDDD